MEVTGNENLRPNGAPVSHQFNTSIDVLYFIPLAPYQKTVSAVQSIGSLFELV
jgi:hypothetical protein